MLAPSLLLGLCLSLTATASPSSSCPSDIGPSGVQVRLPPPLVTSSYPPFWTPPPTGFYFKLWSMIYASSAQFTAFRNLQYDPSPIHPAHPTGQVNDLTSFQLPGNDTIYTSYGIDTPNYQWPAVLDYAGTGILEGAMSQYSLLAWGCDKSGNPYYASYSTAAELTQTPAGIDIMSTEDQGLDEETAEVLIEMLKALPNEELSGLASGLVRMVQDGGRDGLPRVVCDDSCKTNENLIGIIG
ncbi:hypothetical protein DE146DRAFT_667924 [Phaeosphaeria sp. MPI-PUGE-AT-0046c]|nr:hypothetical protein DE146DRAFT_667924 [Phaeosphaeria sp. MPI-PUGE-AT-0046c]